MGVVGLGAGAGNAAAAGAGGGGAAGSGGGAAGAGGGGAAGSGGVAPVAPTPAPMVAARTPYMGWNTYYGVGGVFDQATILSVARRLLHSGLASAGYRIVWLDFGWASGRRTADGEIAVDAAQWPRGLRWLTGWLHRHGLLAGIYTDAGRSGCHEEGLGSFGHYQQDADRFAAWGFDAVKVDFCGAGQEGLDPRPLYAAFARALRHNSSHRRMLLNVCNFWVPGQINGYAPSLANSSYENAPWAHRIAQSWRTDTDIGTHDKVEFVNVIRNLDADARDPRVAGPGHWNDPDYLAPQLGMTFNQARAQLTMWAMVAAPLIIGSDPRKLSRATVRMLEDPGVIAIDQDPLGIQGRLVASEGRVQIWVRRLQDGQRAVAFLNPSRVAGRAVIGAARAGLPAAAGYRVVNVWHGHLTYVRARLGARVGPGSVVLLRVAAVD